MTTSLSTSRAAKTFYPTPETLLDKLTEGYEWRRAESILEPSAGKGDIARFCVKHRHLLKWNYSPHDEYGWLKATRNEDIDCIEIDPELRRVLKGGEFRVVHDDFLTFQTQKRYDLIVMNPPFDQGAKHLLHALEICERGGTIFCILNAETIRNPFSQERRELIDKLTKYGADIRYESDAFSEAERKTDVEVALIHVEIPKVKIDSTIMEEMRKAPTWKKSEVPESVGTLAQYSDLENIVNRYNYEIACGIRLIEEWDAMKDFIVDNSNHKPILLLKLIKYDLDSYNRIEAVINDYISATRAKYWRYLFGQPIIVDKMTTNLQNELRDSVEKLKDYEFSVYNILTLIIKMNSKVVKGIEDTIIELFDNWTRLDWHESSPNRHYYNGWKTNDCFRVGKKVIIPFYGAFDSWDKAFRAYAVESRIRDVEKVFDFLDNGRTDWAGSLDGALRLAEATGNTRNIDTKYFTVTIFKKGTAHFVFKDDKVLEKFNLFASTRKGWLPPTYGKKHYADMTQEEKAVVDSYQGSEKYEQILNESDYYLTDNSTSLLLTGVQN